MCMYTCVIVCVVCVCVCVCVYVCVSPSNRNSLGMFVDTKRGTEDEAGR